jgi:hypothetical protein
MKQVGGRVQHHMGRTEHREIAVDVDDPRSNRRPTAARLVRDRIAWCTSTTSRARRDAWAGAQHPFAVIPFVISVSSGVPAVLVQRPLDRDSVPGGTSRSMSATHAAPGVSPARRRPPLGRIHVAPAENTRRIRSISHERPAHLRTTAVTVISRSCNQPGRSVGAPADFDRSQPSSRA